jgi:hypothetical protein
MREWTAGREMTMKTRHKRFVMVVVACLAAVALSPTRANANVLDALFGDRSELSGVLIDKVGSAILKVLHPTSRHWLTKATRPGKSEVLFTTEYKGWLKSHVLTWRVTFNSEGRIEDIVIEDSNPMNSGPLAKAVVMQLKEHVTKFIEEYKKERLSSR